VEGKTLALAVGATGLGAIALGTLLLYMGEPPPPPDPPKPPPPPEVTMNATLKYSPSVYRGLIETDARTYKVPIPTPDQLAQPNRYFEELKGHRHLRAKDRKGNTVETPHLRLTTTTAKKKATLEGQSFAVDHLVLRIENRTDKYLAYRVETSVTDKHKCSSKGDIAHNAMVLEPNQTIERTECLWRADEDIDVTHVEVIELPPLGAYYVSRLPANPTLYDPRTSAGHTPLILALCPQTFSWRDIQDGIEKREIGWRDVIDFYARHNCDEYSFFRSYRYRTSASAALPARPLD
jgi:hypothetical protein